jgi:hypothetical protein
MFFAHTMLSKSSPTPRNRDTPVPSGYNSTSPHWYRTATPAEPDAAAHAYRYLSALADRPKLLVASSFDRLGEPLPLPTRSRASPWTSPDPPPATSKTWRQRVDCPVSA